MVQGTEGEEREELKVVRSEGEESEEEDNAEKRLQEMQALASGQQSSSSSDRPDSLAGIYSLYIATLTLAMSYDTAVDIESVLAEVRQPVRQYSLKHDPGQPESYNHTSLKKKLLETEDLQMKETSIQDEVCMCR